MIFETLSFLVVEDNAFQLHCIAQYLSELGARDVFRAQDGQAALKIIDEVEQPIDIVICDVNMPGMDGLEFIRHWSERGDPSSLILMSAVAPDLLGAVASMALAYKVHLLGVTSKPVTPAKLAGLVELHRSNQPCSAGPENDFSFREITQAWTGDEFECWFEPQVYLSTGALRGICAVPRWRHPLKGVLKPEAFIPALLARRLSDDFGWRHLQHSIAHWRRLQRHCGGRPMSVTLAFQSISEVDLAPRLLHIVQAEGVDPRSIILAVDERALQCQEVARVLETLARLRLLGFGLALDDFGKGWMAMDQISLASFSEIRIRSSFVTGANYSESTRAGLAVALHAARDLKVSAVATGIASKDEWALLHEWGCNFGQGPLIAEPMPARTIAPWTIKWQARQLLTA